MNGTSNEQNLYLNLQQKTTTLGQNLSDGFEKTVEGVTRDVNRGINTALESVTTGDFVYQGWASIVQATINIRRSLSSTIGRWAFWSNLISFILIGLFIVILGVSGTSGAFGGYGSVLWSIPFFWLACFALYINWNVGQLGYGKYNVMSRILNLILFFAIMVVAGVEITYIVKFSIDATIAPAVRNGTFTGLAVNATLNGTVSYLPGIWSPAVLLDPEYGLWISMNTIHCLVLVAISSLAFTSFGIFSWSSAWNSVIKRELLFTEKMNMVNGFAPLPGKSVVDWVQSLNDNDTSFTADHADFVRHINWHSKHDRHTTGAQKKSDANA